MSPLGDLKVSPLMGGERDGMLFNLPRGKKEKTKPQQRGGNETEPSLDKPA